MDEKTRKRLAEIVSDELESPGRYTEILDELQRVSPLDEPLLRFLAVKDEQHRMAFYVKSQHVWYRKFGWRLMRPLFIVAVFAGVGFALQKAIDPVLGVACFLAGAAALYIVIQIFAHLWANRDLQQLDKVNARYRDSLRDLLESLRK